MVGVKLFEQAMLMLHGLITQATDKPAALGCNLYQRLPAVYIRRLQGDEALGFEARQHLA